MQYQPIYDIADVCARQGLNQVVLCPGSRCAPLTLAFTRHETIQTRTFSDERSAGFVAYGIAQQTGVPSILVCTSGSAAYNFAPAIAEAFYQQVPLIVFTADRPSEWVDQYDGQTIRQNGIYGSHVKKSFTLPEDYSHPDASWFINRIVNDAINAALEFPRGPVHINAPFREPLYPPKFERIRFRKNRIIDRPAEAPGLSETAVKNLSRALGSFDKILIVPGQDEVHDGLSKAVERFIKKQHAACVGDVISNWHRHSTTTRYADSFLAQGNDGMRKSLQPDLLITFGKSIISKNVKLFLRQYRPQQHWHIQPAGPVADTFQSLTKIIATSPAHFFESLADATRKESSFEAQKRENYSRLWDAEEHRTERAMRSFFSMAALSELHLVYEILKSLPARCNLHLANSMAVRYANFIGLDAYKKGVHVFSNRGTSGIDGCTSTTVGHAMASDVPNFLITGDMAFFYDRNAFWHNYSVPNLRIVLLNNHGGSIFNLIDGPGDLPEKDEYFVTRQALTARHLSGEFGIHYLKLDSLKKLKPLMKDFYEFDGKTKILELETSTALNKDIVDQFKRYLRKGYE